MPKRHRVATLRDLALKSVGEYVTIFGKNIVRKNYSCFGNNDPKSALFLNSLLLATRQQLGSSVPWHLYDRMALEILKAIRNLINEARSTHSDRSVGFITEISVAISLTHLIAHSNLRAIEFSCWPKIMRHALYDALLDMTGLEVLDLGSGSAGWRTSNIEKIIVNAVRRMTRLVSFTLCFDCTDNIINAVCENCSHLRKLDATASRSVTDRSITSLANCHQLREVKLSSTSVSVPGFASLLLSHPRLESIGRYDELGLALEYANEPLRLKSFECRNMNTRNLYLLVELCPYIQSLSLLRDDRISDLSILASLGDLRDLKLLSCDFYANGLHTLLEISGPNLTSLHLEHVGVIDLDALIHISRCCPNLRSLAFCNCEFSIHSSFRHENQQHRRPFEFLEQLKCVADCADAHLEYILMHCVNVRSVHLGSSTGIGDSTMRRVFSVNKLAKLEELQILYSDDLSMSTVRLLMKNCSNLRRLSELESWEGISAAQLDAFRQELKSQNFDLDTSPTLSLA